MLGTGIVFLAIMLSIYSTQDRVVTFECSTEFWKDNVDLWEITGVDPHSDFDETFGKDYFEPNITLLDAINRDGVGLDHIAKSGTTAYLNAIMDPTIDEETIRTMVGFGYVHQLDKYLDNCNDIERTIPNLLF